MWLMTTDGFYSVVRWTKDDEHKGALCVRARERAPLEALRSAIDDPSRVTPITVGADGDYRYRLWMDDIAAGWWLVDVAGKIRYPNFKDAVFDRQGASLYEKALHKVWSIMSGLQPGGPYGVGGDSYPPVPSGEPVRSRRRPVRIDR